MSDPITLLEAQIAENKRKVAQQESALIALKAALGVEANSTQQFTQPTAQSKALNFLDLEIQSLPSRKDSFIEQSKQIVMHYAGHEFTVRHVEAGMIKQGVDIDSKTPRAKIANALRQLAEDGVIVRTFEGKGNDPHRYILKSETPTVGTVGVSNVNQAAVEADRNSSVV